MDYKKLYEESGHSAEWDSDWKAEGYTMSYSQYQRMRVVTWQKKERYLELLKRESK
jgi:hypothetical protein